MFIQYSCLIVRGNSNEEFLIGVGLPPQTMPKFISHLLFQGGETKSLKAKWEFLTGTCKVVTIVENLPFFFKYLESVRIWWRRRKTFVWYLKRVQNIVCYYFFEQLQQITLEVKTSRATFPRQKGFTKWKNSPICCKPFQRWL